MSTIQQLHKEAQDLRAKADAARRQATVHADKAKGFSQHQEYPRAQVEEVESQKLIEQAVNYEQAAMQKDQEAGNQEQKANDLERRKQELRAQVDQLDKEIQQIRGTPVGRIFP